MDRHGMKMYQIKCLQILVYKTKNTYPEINKSNIETSNKNMRHGIRNLKIRNPKSIICTKDRTTMWIFHIICLGRAHFYAQGKGFIGNQQVNLPIQEEVEDP
jgi:hypothetical protein